MVDLRSSFSVAVADLVRSGVSVGEALRQVLVMRDGSGPRTTDVLNDLQDMGVWTPRKGRH